MKKIFIALLLLGLTTAAALAGPVTLHSAKVTAVRYDATSAHFKLKGYIEIENIGSPKQVNAFYKIKGTSQWFPAYATYVAPTWSNREAWYFETEAVLGTDIEYDFAVRATINGVDYWDNNNGANYTIGYGAPPIAKNAILNTAALLLYKANTYKTTYQGLTQVSFTGRVFIKNIAYEKIIKIVYTTDNWTTTKETYGRFENGTPTNVEHWSFHVKLPEDVTNIQFAIAYEVNGFTYWDNNFGQNYSIGVPQEIQ